MEYGEMGKGKIEDNPDWENDFDHLAPVAYVLKTQCKQCSCAFSIRSVGLWILNNICELSPESSSDATIENQRASSVVSELDKKNNDHLKKVTRAEMLHAIKVDNNNY